MPMGLGAALGSKISKSAMFTSVHVCLCRQLVLDGAHLVEEAPEEAQLAHLADQRRGLSARETGRQFALDRLRASLDARGHRVDAGDVLGLLRLVERLSL